MLIRAEISPLQPRFDARGAVTAAKIRELGIAIGQVEVRDVYFLAGEALDAATGEQIVTDLLVDPVVQGASWKAVTSTQKYDDNSSGLTVIEVSPLPGVTDTAAESLLFTARSLGDTSLQQASTGVKYVFDTQLTAADAKRIAQSLLANEVVQAWGIDTQLSAPFLADTGRPEPVEIVPIRGVSDEQLLAVSKERRLALDLNEMRAAAKWFVTEGRDPTDLELETLAQTWSEHCVHKTFKARIHHVEPGRDEIVDSIYNTYIKAATRENDSDWLKSVFVDNAGIVGFDDNFDIAFKVETHNHPSALEPFGGANTGVGGVVRDIIGVSAHPIATTDVLCFAAPDTPLNDVPEGVLHPTRIASGVVAGIEDYGNKMGIPTVNGAVLYDPGYMANPLVFCGCLGILPKGSHRTNPQVGDHIVVLGGSTGRDGLRGATFSSMEMGTETALVAGSSVQIGHPIAEKAVLEAVKLCRDAGLYTAITDCGAGGLSSAVGEMGEKLGAHVQLERVPLKYAGLSPWEVWLSEAQERIVLAVSEDKLSEVARICGVLDVQMYSLGTFSGDARLVVRNGDEVVGDLAMALLHDGIPLRELESEWQPPVTQEASFSNEGADSTVDIGAELLAILALPEVRSKADIVRMYDHEVQGGTLVKPFVGVTAEGPSDAAVLVPLDAVRANGGLTGPAIGLAVGINPAYGKLDPYAMAFSAVDECVRNLVATGVNPRKIALLDNFCWGNPKLPDRLGSMVRASRGCYDAAIAYKAPFISGKDSLNNEYTGADGKKHAIPGTLLISGLGIVPDCSKTATSDLKAAGNSLWIIGETADELGGSVLLRRHGELGKTPPQPVVDPLVRYDALHEAITAGWVRACHDLSEGGLAVAIAEMALGGGLGADIDLDALPAGATTSPWRKAFSESNGRLLVEVTEAHAPAFAQKMAAVPHARVGAVNGSGTLVLRTATEKVCNVQIEQLRAAFAGHVPGFQAT